MGNFDPLWQHFLEQHGKNAWDIALSLENGKRGVIVCGKTRENMKYLQLMSKVVQYVHPPILGVSPLAKVVHYVHPSIFKPPWMSKKSG